MKRAPEAEWFSLGIARLLSFEFTGSSGDRKPEDRKHPEEIAQVVLRLLFG
ncbi:MAG: hypothetical protein AAGF15_07595 [Pseudomonadota bacterium]